MGIMISVKISGNNNKSNIILDSSAGSISTLDMNPISELEPEPESQPVPVSEVEPLPESEPEPVYEVEPLPEPEPEPVPELSNSLIISGYDLDGYLVSASGELFNLKDIYDSSTNTFKALNEKILTTFETDSSYGRFDISFSPIPNNIFRNTRWL